MKHLIISLILILVFPSCKTKNSMLFALDQLAIESKARNNRDNELNIEYLNKESACENQGNVRLDLDFECILCEKNKFFSGFKFLTIRFEEQPYRQINEVVSVPLSSNYKIESSFCVEKIPNQNSHIIGFSLNKTIKDTYEYISYNNIELDRRKYIKVIKKIGPDEFQEKMDCEYEPLILYDTHPYSNDMIGLSQNFGLIGGVGDYMSSGEITKPIPKESINILFKKMKTDYKKSRSYYPHAFPCADLFYFLR